MIDERSVIEDIKYLISHVYDKNYEYAYKTCLNIVERQPIAETIEIIRCKDCRKNATGECAMHIECDCGIHSWNEGDDFCSWGERGKK